MKTNWSTLIPVIGLLSFVTYMTLWVVIGNEMPLWLKILVTFTIGLGLTLMVVTNLDGWERKTNDRE